MGEAVYQRPRSRVGRRVQQASADPPVLPTGWDAWDTVFAVGAVLTAAVYVARTRGLIFSIDDWPLAVQSRHLSRYLDSYNGHLSIVPVVFYRLILSAVGLKTYVPFRVEFATALVAVAASMFLTVRSRLGPLPALVVGTSVLWYHDLTFQPQAANHLFALAGSVLCAWALPRKGRRMDMFIAAALTFALCSSGVGVAGAAGCLVFVVLTRPPIGRWVAISVPTALWLVWWLLFSKPTGELPRTFDQKVHFVLTGVRLSFEGLVFGNRVLGVMLMLAFLVLAGLRARNGLRTLANQVAWTAALLAWWIGVATSRGLLLAPYAFRYRFVGSAFIVLAFLPNERSTAGDHWLSKRRRDPAVIGLGVIAAIVVVALNAGGIFDVQRSGTSYSGALIPYYVVANLGPSAVPDNAGVNGVTALNAAQYRELVAQYGAVPGTRPAHPDRTISGGLRLVRVPRVPRAVCRGPSVERVEPTVALLEAGRTPAVVQVRRFERPWLTVGRIGAGGRRASLALPGFGSTTPWQLRVLGGCVVRKS